MEKVRRTMRRRKVKEEAKNTEKEEEIHIRRRCIKEHHGKVEIMKKEKLFLDCSPPPGLQKEEKQGG